MTPKHDPREGSWTVKDERLCPKKMSVFISFDFSLKQKNPRRFEKD